MSLDDRIDKIKEELNAIEAKGHENEDYILVNTVDAIRKNLTVIKTETTGDTKNAN